MKDLSVKKSKRREWDEYFLRMLWPIARKSEDPNTQLACIIVGQQNHIVSTGYNGLARGVKLTDERCSRDNGEKYLWFEHCERNALYNAARHGSSVNGCRAYTYDMPCPDCARGLIQSGIKEIIMMKNSPLEEHVKRWADRYERSKVMLKEAGVKVTKVEM